MSPSQSAQALIEEACRRAVVWKNDGDDRAAVARKLVELGVAPTSAAKLADQAFRHSPGVEARLLPRGVGNMLLGISMFAGGFALSAFGLQIAAAAQANDFLIFLGPMVAGAVVFVGGLVQYLHPKA